MPTLRFVQTSDWHLGQSYGSVGADDLSARLRQARLDAVTRVLHEAGNRGAAFVLVAGDQFEGEMPNRETVTGMLDRIRDHPRMPVHMIPGNHDPAGTGSVYGRSDFTRGAPLNLHFHGHAGAVAMPEHAATLYPCPCLARFGDDPMAWIPHRGMGDGFRIALAHGSLPRFANPGDRNYPIRDDAPAFHDLDYVALGDWHTANPDPEHAPHDRMYYAGAPEVGGWDETAAGTFLEVNLSTGAAPEVRAHHLRQFDWFHLDDELHDSDDVRRLLEVLSRKASPTTLARVRPKGALAVAARIALEAEIEARSSAFACLAWDGRDLRAAMDPDDDLPRDPLIREVYDRLRRLAADPADGPPEGLPKDVPGPDADVVTRALSYFRGQLC